MGASRRRGNVPNIVNTPTGPREREERPRMPVTRPRDISYKVPDRERREEAKRQEKARFVDPIEDLHIGVQNFVKKQ